MGRTSHSNANKGKDKSVASPPKSKGCESPRSPKLNKRDSPLSKAKEVKKMEPISVNVTPFPVSTSTEMTMAMNAEASNIQERLVSMYHLIHDIQEERNRSEHTLSNIAKTHEKIKQEQKLTPYYKSKLKGLYATAVADADQEAALIRKALEKIYEVRNIRNEVRIQAKHSGNKETIRRGALMKMLINTAQTLPLWIGKPGEEPPPLCGAIPAESNYIAKSGDMVAALVRGTEGEDNWILAEVIKWNQTTNKYEIEDIDEEQKERLMLSRRRVIPLPLMRANPETHPEAVFSKGAVVMALYPQTTCFYKGLVNKVPETAVGEYQVLFEDPSYADGYSPPLNVAQRYVIANKEKKTKN